MRIALFSTLYPFRGGIAQFGAALYRELEKKHQVSGFTFTRQYPSLLFPGQTQFVTDGDKADAISAEQCLDSINPISYYRTASRILSAQPDLLINNFWMPFFAPSTGYLAGKVRKAGIPAIAILHNVVPHEKRPGDLQLLRYFFNRHDGFIALSDVVQQDLLSLKPDALSLQTPHPVYQHFGAPLPIETARAQLGIPLDKNVSLFFGFIRKYKGLDLLIEAMHHLPDDHLLVVAGEMYGDFAEYQKMIDTAGVGHKIKLLVRYVNDDEVAQLFSAADVLVLPYKSATQSGVAHIAYHFSLPMIVTDVGSLAESVRDGESGLVVRSLSSAELAEKMAFYFNNRCRTPFAKAMQKDAYTYSWEALADRIMQLYGQIRSDRS
ncbi:MAG: glycosyltransferase [Deferribacteres bacterium]|nr:glycosyltransferase [candidate division KSB1 bacterium]MCB9510096.1 glycosyltransferase [Deferribacteres bacterium]